MLDLGRIRRRVAEEYLAAARAYLARRWDTPAAGWTANKFLRRWYSPTAAAVEAAASDGPEIMRSLMDVLVKDAEKVAPDDPGIYFFALPMAPDGPPIRFEYGKWHCSRCGTFAQFGDVTRESWAEFEAEHHNHRRADAGPSCGARAPKLAYDFQQPHGYDGTCKLPEGHSGKHDDYVNRW